MPKFVDFRLLVRRISGDGKPRYVTAVADAPTSGFGQEFDWFGGGPDWAEQLAGTNVDVRKSHDKRYRLVFPEDETDTWNPEREVALGRALFELLFPAASKAQELLGRSCQRAAHQQAHLRLLLDIHPHLSNLPWELIKTPLHCPWVQDIEAVKIAMVRFLGDTYRPEPISAEQSVQPQAVILLKSDPRDLAKPLITDSLYQERDEIRRILGNVAPHLEVVVVEGANTLRQLSDAVERIAAGGGRLIGVHFMGHGGVDQDGSFFVGTGSDGLSARIYESKLRDALDQAGAIEWVIFNACWLATEPVGCPLSSLATSVAVLKGVPTVLAFRRPVQTKDAEAVAGVFYQQAIGEGKPIDEVVRGIQLRYDHPGGLVLLRQTINGRLQDVVSPATPTAAPPQPHPPDDRVPRQRPPVVVRTPGAATPSTETADVPMEMIEVPAGISKRCVDEAEAKSLLKQFRRSGLPLDEASVESFLANAEYEPVTLPAFRLGRTLVTNAQFAAFVAATGYVTEAEKAGNPENWRENNTPEKAEHPVTFVSFNDAMEFCRRTGRRLPSVDEWVRAYRGDEGRLYPWGNAFDAGKCNTAESMRGHETSQVTALPGGAGPYGHLDIVGNVEEWTWTSEPDGGTLIVGGSWRMTCQVWGAVHAAPTRPQGIIHRRPRLSLRRRPGVIGASAPGNSLRRTRKHCLRCDYTEAAVMRGCLISPIALAADKPPPKAIHTKRRPTVNSSP